MRDTLRLGPARVSPYVRGNMLCRLLILLALLLPAPALASAVSQQPNTRVELLAETKAPKPGETFTLGVSMTARPGWHTYWVNPGDAGIETRAEWRTPPGVTVGAFRYPVPRTYLVGGIMNHVFEGEAILLADVKLPAEARGALPIEVRLDWLVCDDKICVPESATLSLPLMVGDGAPDPAVATRFDSARKALPQALGTSGAFTTSADRVRIQVPVSPEGIARAHFFPLAHDLIDMAAPQQLAEQDGQLIVEMKRAANPGPTEPRTRGVLRIERTDGSVLGLDLNLTEGSVPPGRPLQAAAQQSRAGNTFWPALGLAILGGLLLNLMPCVFPILSLKAMSLAKSGQSAAHARTEGLAYTAGVVLVTTALGLAAILIAQAGQGAGWAFQLQDPRVILFLLLLTFAIGLNFAGLFEVNLGAANAGAGLAARPGAQGAFFTGGLAAFVATPCTGPFMAGALGAALVLPPAAGLAVFAGLGLGLALPFLAIGFVPALRRRLPKPGPWMLTFRRILAVPMLLTALALAWVLGRQAGAEGLTAGLAAALALGLALWILGLRQQQGRRAPLAASLAIAVALAAPLALARLPDTGGTALAATAAPGELEAVAFSPEALAEARSASRPTFLYFTADWCVTCKVNERGALASPRVAEAFRAAGIQVMVGDWTRPDPAIARFLEERGRAGIPLYLFYAADGSVEELPQILTVDRLVGLASKGSSAIT
ncbi:MAG: protein-disulfide reductase DsbD family protein [Sphingomonadaceae bacterium]